MCSDGSSTSEQAARFAAYLLKASGNRVTLFGVVEDEREAGAIKHSLDLLFARLRPARSELTTQMAHGHAAEEILKEAESGDYDLIVVGARGRRGLTRFLLGSTSSRVVQYAPCSVLVVKKSSEELRRILVCTAGGEPGLRDVRFAAAIGAAAEAEMTVMHVMSQIALSEDSDLYDLEASAEELIARGAREGVHLKAALELMRQAGVRGKIKVRHGLVVDEIDAEERDGRYDIVVVGAHFASGFGRLLLDNVTAHVLEVLDRAVLVVRDKQTSNPLRS
jgi:nucleotide-binding universal stress UspA family protein